MRGRRAGGRPADRPLALRAHVVAWAAAVAILTGLTAIGASPALEWWLHGPGSLPSRALAWVTGAVPFSIAEWVEVAVGLWLVIAGGRAAVQVARGRRSVGNAAASGALQVTAVALLALVLFYGLWGLNYARAPAIERLDLDPVDLGDPRTVAELASLAEALVDGANARYRALHGSTDAGVPTVPAGPGDDALDQGWVRVVAELGLHPTVAISRGPAKPLLLSPVFSAVGVSGFYFPFTAEANVNTLPPAWSRPHTSAHEMAHQRGFASEDEASFFGLLACLWAHDPWVAYSGVLYAQRRLLITLLDVTPERAAALIARRYPGVQRDVDASRSYAARWSGRGTAVGSAVNDAYLRANRVEGGVRSYSLAARLIVAWFRDHPADFGPSGQASGQDSAASSSVR